MGVYSGGSISGWTEKRDGFFAKTKIKQFSYHLIFKTSKLIRSYQIKYRLIPLQNWMTCIEAGVTGSLRDAPEGKRVLNGVIEIPCAL